MLVIKVLFYELLFHGLRALEHVKSNFPRYVKYIQDFFSILFIFNDGYKSMFSILLFYRLRALKPVKWNSPRDDI